MKGLLLFVAGLLCGGAAVAWLFLAREPASPPVAVESTLPAPTGADSGLPPDLALTPPARDPHESDGLDVDPLDEIPTPLPGVPPLQGADGLDAARGDIDPTAVDTPDATGVAPAPADTDATVGEGRIVDSGPAVAKEEDKSAPAAAAGDADAPTPPDPEVLAGLERTTLLMPVQGITTADLYDTYSDARGEGRSHDAIDIMAPTGRPVRAVADGRIAKLFASVPGGLTIYQFDGEERLAYYYAHLDRYADDLQEGATVKRGDVIGYVGATGNANKDAPHLHFAIFVLGPEKRWWQGTPVNPYPVLKRADTEVGEGP